MTKDHEVDENPREALTPVDPLTRQKYYGSSKHKLDLSGALKRLKAINAWLDSPHPKGGVWLDYVDDGFMEAWSDADEYALDESSPAETKQRRKGICICPKGETRGDCPACGDAEHRLPEKPTETPPDTDAEVFTRAVVAGVARWEFFTGSDDQGEVCVGGLRYTTRLDVGVPVLGPAMRAALERHTVWKQHTASEKVSGVVTEACGCSRRADGFKVWCGKHWAERGSENEDGES